VTAENIRTTTGSTHITESKLECTICTGVVVTVCVLRATHTPNKCAWTIVCHDFGNTPELATWNASYTLGFSRTPFF
jgi:hypothetical protein